MGTQRAHLKLGFIVPGLVMSGSEPSTPKSKGGKGAAPLPPMAAVASNGHDGGGTCTAITPATGTPARSGHGRSVSVGTYHANRLSSASSNAKDSKKEKRESKSKMLRQDASESVSDVPLKKDIYDLEYHVSMI